MAAILWTDVTMIAASLTTGVSAGAQALYLLFANEALDARLFADGEADNRLKLARIYLVAHYASSVFEGIRAYGQRNGAAIFRLDDHMDRLMGSAKIYRMELPFTHAPAAAQ